MQHPGHYTVGHYSGTLYGELRATVDKVTQTNLSLVAADSNNITSFEHSLNDSMKSSSIQCQWVSLDFFSPPLLSIILLSVCFTLLWSVCSHKPKKTMYVYLPMITDWTVTQPYCSTCVLMASQTYAHNYPLRTK